MKLASDLFSIGDIWFVVVVLFMIDDNMIRTSDRRVGMRMYTTGRREGDPEVVKWSDDPVNELGQVLSERVYT